MKKTKLLRRFLLAAVFGISPIAFGGGTITWPLPVVPQDVSTTTAEPRLDWLQRVQTNFDQSRKMASVDLIFDGDSITDFWQAVGKGKEIWNQRYAKLNAFDFGIAADRTEHVLWRLQNGQLDGLHPKLVVLLIGTNNLGGNTNEQVVKGVQAIVGEYQKRCPDTAILLQGIFPRGEPANFWARPKIKAINQTLASLAGGKKVIFLDFGDKFLNPDGTLSPEIMPDFLHPSAKGYQIWADAIQPVIDRFFAANGSTLSPR
jgi:lysophospholipase L1-like esterase